MRERIIANFDTFLRSFEIEKFETQMYIYQRSIILGYLDVDGNIEGYTRHGARTTGKLTGPSTVVAAYDQINGREKERERGGREGEREYLWYANSKRTNED